MYTKIILILGGYGGTGRIICRKLLETTDVSIIIAGRNIKEAEELSIQLKKEFPNKNISAIFADASDYNSLVSAFKNITLVIDATTATQYVKNVARAALEAGIDYLDFHFEQKVVSELETLRKEIESSGHIFITQAGFHPGLPAVFVRYAASEFDEYKKAIIGMAMNTKIEKPESIYELVDVLADFNVDIFKKSKWRKANYLDYKMIDFGERFGVKMCYPLQMEEMRLLPKMFPLEETGVYVAGFNWFIDYLVMPFAIILPKIKKGLGRHMIAKMLIYGFNNFSGKNLGVSFVIDAEGIKNGKLKKFRVIAEHEDAYLFTAIPIVACVQQYLNGSMIKPGLHLMGHVVEPNRLMKDMEKMGIKISYNK
ncbi:MAG: saccharopine dehydrogenase NADP-binding domain-containing protein [Candidatus Paceibacterota bacterium]|jgi:saccharopine dehydrogenase (NAD+, L-lysine-forming)